MTAVTAPCLPQPPHDLTLALQNSAETMVARPSVYASCVSGPPRVQDWTHGAFLPPSEI
jgi:hypothetical protein